MISTAIDHPKMRRLARLLNIPIAYANGIMERLWHAAETHAAHGGIGIYSDEEIWHFCGVGNDIDPSHLVEILIKCGFLDLRPKCRLFIHDWPDHCTHYVHTKLARNRLFFANNTAPALTSLSQAARKPLLEFYQQNIPIWDRSTALRRPGQVDTFSEDVSDTASAQKAQTSAQKAQTSAQKAQTSARFHQEALTDVEIKGETVSEMPRKSQMGGYASAQKAQTSAQKAQTSAQKAQTSAHHTTPHHKPSVSLEGSSAIQDFSKQNFVRTYDAKLFPSMAAAIRSFPGCASTDDAFVVSVLEDSFRTYERVVNGHAAPPLTDSILAQAVKESHFAKQKGAGPFKARVPRCIRTWIEQEIKAGHTAPPQLSPEEAERINRETEELLKHTNELLNETKKHKRR